MGRGSCGTSVMWDEGRVGLELCGTRVVWDEACVGRGSCGTRVVWVMAIVMMLSFCLYVTLCVCV